METALFLVYAFVACAGAVAVVVSQNVVRMAFWLIVSLSAVSGLFFTLNADFLGAAQLLIYVGGTVVLLIFGVMLTASGPFLKIQTQPGDLVQAGVVGLAFLAFVGGTVLSVDWAQNSARLETVALPNQVTAPGYHSPQVGGTVRDIGMALLGVRATSGRTDADSPPTAEHSEHNAADHPAASPSSAPPASTRVGYLLPFEIISVHLLVVLVGAAYLARAKRRVSSSVTGSTQAA